MPNVEYVIPALVEMLPQYQIISDCIKGEIAVKKRGVAYLPMPNSTDTSAENKAAYENLKVRASFVGFTGRTLRGLLGTIFTYTPTITVPEQLDLIVQDATGGGVTLVQLSKQNAGYGLSLGRSGLFVDYPDTGTDGATVADVASGKARPTLAVYPPQDIINWRKQEYGAKEKHSLIVLRETYVVEDDGFEEVRKVQYRVLRLISGKYWQLIYRDSKSDPYKTVQPLDAKGEPFDEIPFKFIGSEDNDSDPDLAPLYDLAAVNLAHYRNSADQEQFLHILQPTPYFTGLTQEWIKQVWKGTTEIEFGARAVIALPEGATAGLLEPADRNGFKIAMDDKERQMASLGADMVSEQAVQRTATEANIDNASDNSVLTNTADNVSAAYTWALKVCAQFMGVPTTVQVTEGTGETAKTTTKELEFVLNTAFNLSNLTPEELKQLMALWVGGAITWSEFRTRLRYAGVATLSDEDAKAELEEQLANDTMAEMDRLRQETEITGEPDNTPPGA